MASTTSRKRILFQFAEEPIAIKDAHDEQIYINPSILAANSKVFARALSNTWRPPSVKTFDFNTIAPIDVKIFNYYANWCQNGEIDLIVENVGNGAADERERSRQRFHLLTEIFHLADVADDKALRNAVMDKVLDLAASSGYRPGDTTISLAFDKLPENSSLCRFLVDDALSGISEEWLRECHNDLPEEYLKKLFFGWARIYCWNLGNTSCLHETVHWSAVDGAVMLRAGDMVAIAQ